jgi:hypothetical protein
VHTPAPDPLQLIPRPSVVQDRLGDLYREERVLRRLLKIAVAAADERARRRSAPTTVEGGRP